MPAELSKRSYWLIPVEYSLKVVIKSQPVDLTGKHSYFGELYDGGKMVFGTFGHPSTEEAKDEVVEWTKKNYKIVGTTIEGR